MSGQESSAATAEIVAMRPADETEIPTGARRLAKLAEDSGWTVTITYARGYPGPSADTPVGSICVRMSKPPCVAVGLWEDGKFRCALMRVAGARGILRLNSRRLRAFMKASA